MSKKLVLYLVLLIIVAVSIYFYREYNRRPADLEDAKPVFKITATDLVNEFETDEATANKKYLGKIIQVTGVLSSKENHGDTLVNITIGNGMHKVGCRIDKRLINEINQFTISNIISIK